ncbi:hypothetical protein CL635_00405 [bacterium]|nr:hypothetical protein [bacterium]|tara:strand:+ start:1260 stop:3827 length:2568 start_codon:yes stop_codon:yes gene_type:complete
MYEIWNNRRIGSALLAIILLVVPAAADANTQEDYTDIFIYNFDISDDFDKVTFDLSRRIPKTQQFKFPFVLVKGKENLGTIHGDAIDGGKHVSFQGLANLLKQHGYGTYSLVIQVCPGNTLYQGSGWQSGCGPANSMSIEYFPWKLTSSSSGNERMIFSGPGETFTVTARPTSQNISGNISLSVKTVYGQEASESLDCIQKQQQPLQWQCTVNEESAESESTAVLVLEDESGTVASNTLLSAVFNAERLEAARFTFLCEIHLLENNGNRYSYEVVRRNTRNRDALCGDAFYNAHSPARIVAGGSHTLTIEAPPTEYFTIFAEKGDGSGPRILHGENTFDPGLLLQSSLCQTLVKQDENTFTLLRRNKDGKEVSSCFFPGHSIVPIEGSPRILSQSRNHIVIDATESSVFDLNISGGQYHRDYESFPSPSVGGVERGSQDAFIQALLPGRSTRYEIVAAGSDDVQTALPHFGGFSDVSTNHPYVQAIEYIRDKGIVKGFPDGTFRPDATINRAEFSKIIVGATNDKDRIEKCGSTYFIDARLGEWYNKYICTAKDEGIVDGYPDGTFRHGNPIAFVEAAKIIVKAFGLPTETNERDIWFVPFTDVLAEKRTIPLSIKSLDQKITRGEMAEIAYRLYIGETQLPTVNYEQMLRDSGVLSEKEQEMISYEWRGEEVPSDILRFTNLETLILNNYDLSRIPDEIGQLEKLKHLIVFTNNLSQTPPSLTQWTNLRTLALEGNGKGSKLTVLPNDIGNLENLNVLRLHNNSITKLPSSIGKLSKLTRLDLKQNALTTLPPEIGSLTALQELNVERNPITVWPKEMANLKNLRLLYAPYETSDEMKAKFKQWFPDAKIYYYR